MRYLISEEFQNELQERQAYLYDIFHLYFIPRKKVDGFIPLVPLGTADESVLFIIGHYDKVLSFFTKNMTTIKEKNMVLITCLAEIIKKKFRNKTLYASYEEEDKMSNCYDGSDYGFGFDITKSELDFYNANRCEKLIERIECSFKKL